MFSLTEFKTSQEENIKKIHDVVSSLKEQLCNLKHISHILSQDQVTIKDPLTSIHSAQQAPWNSHPSASILYRNVQIVQKKNLRYKVVKLPKCKVILDRLSFKDQRQEQWACQLNVEVVGAPEIKTENLTNIVLSIAKKAGVVMSIGDIESCTRVQSKDPVKGRPRNIIIKMSSVFIRIISLLASKNIVTTGDLRHGGELKKIFFNEHLTLDNRRLYKKCR
ncbi:unnamed protein product [Parnassius apollo]|uniref:(apollo) hypothetical protein n=1 Tax=Parnassius apollo TaxID=110799 RepID=A0A8S3Y0L9_PARAO|nr:unnamed protein product [Parnassius apollo]